MTKRLRKEPDEGFSLVEVLVSITLFGLLSTALVPLLITAARASSITRLDTGARNLGQERLEILRTAPFHIDQSAGAGADLLDTFYPNLVAAASINSAGFVNAAGARAKGEPTGPFYRYLVAPSALAPDAGTADNFAAFSQRVATQFLNASGQPFAPASWNSLVSPNDRLVPSLIVRVTVTTTWTVGPLSKSYSVTSNITDSRAEDPLAQGEVRATALSVSSVLPSGADTADLLLEGGVVTANGSITSGATASTSSRGALASLLPGSRIDGASGGSSSPANATSAPVSKGPQVLSDGINTLVRMGSTSSGTSSTSTDFGQIAAGSAASPVSAGVQTNGDITFTNLPNGVGSTLLVDTTRPVLTNNSSGPAEARGQAYLASTSGTTHQVAGTGKASTPLLSVLPTTFAPNGLLQVQLTSSELTCTAGASGASSTLKYAATVRYWTYNPATGMAGYAATPLSLSEATATDQLAALLTQKVHPNPSGGADLTYADYFTSLSNATTSTLAAARTSGPGKAQAQHPGLLSLRTVSLRTDIDSPVNVQVGVLSCLSEDLR